MLAVRLMELMPDLVCASRPLRVRAQTQRSCLLLNSNSKMKQNAAWQPERAFPLSARTPFKKEFFEQGAFPVSARTPFKKEFFAFAPEGGFYVKFMYSLTSDGMHKSD